MDNAKRKFLKGTVIAMAVGGGAVVTVPFISSMRSVQTREEYLEEKSILVDISDIPPGGMKEVKWELSHNTIMIVRRRAQDISLLREPSPMLRDPSSKNSEQPTFATNPHRSQREAYFVATNQCTHLGCGLLYKPDDMHEWDMPDYWRGGFYCPCHASLFDLAGRVYKRSPAQKNLIVPPHYFIDENHLKIGIDGF